MAAAHALPAADVAAALHVDPETGLSDRAAAERLAAMGPNVLVARSSPTLLRLLWGALTEPFVLLLLVAGLLAIAVGEVRDGLLVLIGLVPIVGADVVTEYRGERALEALRESSAPLAAVRRGGTVVEVAAATLVPGDVVLLAVGDVVPADMRLLRADALLFDRSVLTGESVPEAGSTLPDAAETGLVERHSLAFSGTKVVQGRGEGIVVATGTRSELGQIAARLGNEERRRSPVQLELDRLVRILLVVALGLIAITSGLALMRGEPIGVALLAGIAAAIAAIPEEPPVLLAVILGLGAYRLLRRGVLVRRLSAQETLSAVDLILTDKTGTLTLNQLSLDAVFTPDLELSGTEIERLAGLALRAQDDAWQRTLGGRVGSFTSALERFLAGRGLNTELDPTQLILAEPVTAATSFTRTVSRVDGQPLELFLGAPEVVLALVESRGSERTDWHALVRAHAEAGRRLLLLASTSEGAPEPMALLAFSDPLRTDVGDALAMATQAGIQTIVVTGDHLLTAARIADAAGLPPGAAVTGDELARWDEARLAAELPGLRLVARALPEQKLRIVEAARRLGRTVAVTGDGVNDAPALEHADVAIAMGSGAAVAREASDLVLGDDSFATLMSGLREGRRVVANIQKGLIFLVSTHVALLGFVLVATLYGFAQPLLPIHILWLELFIDTTTSVAFEREPAEPDLMRRPPRRRGAPLLASSLLARLAASGAWTALGALAIIVAYGSGQTGATGGTAEGTATFDHARWVAFTALVVGQLVRAYANRSLSRPVLTLGRNTVLVAACLVALVVQLVIPAVPLLADAFRATPLNGEEWLVVGVVAFAPAVLAEMMRALRGREWVA